MELRLIRRPAASAAVATVLALLTAAPALAAGDPGHGKTVFAQQCAMCHTATKGGPAILGPNLFGVVGRKAGTVAGYNYSPAMKAAAWVWNEERLTAYLPGPRVLVPGTKMTYGGLHNPAQLDDLIAYLAGQK